MNTGHNSANRQLTSLVERIERLETERHALASDIKDIYQEAKSAGYDPKIMRILIRDRKMTAVDREERDALVETYRAALVGLADLSLGTPAFGRVL